LNFRENRHRQREHQPRARDNHIRSADLLDVEFFPTATFESMGITVTGDGTRIIKGSLTLHGVTQEVTIYAGYIGGGKDPWGNVRRGFAGTMSFAMPDFGINCDLGPASRTVEMKLHIEGISQ
jgi:polyisoprenoid-binding protein YceI